MENYFYIIIGIAWVVFSIIKGAKKAKVQKNFETEAPEPARKSRIEEFLEEFMPPINKVEPNYKDLEVDEYENLEEQVLTNQDYGSYEPSLENQYIDMEPVSLEEIDDTKALIYEHLYDEEPMAIAKSMLMEKSKAFNLRQAIIYNAILERPYQY